MVNEAEGDGWGPARIAENLDPLTDWFLVADLEDVDPNALFPITVGLKSGDIVGLSDRLAVFATEVNATRADNPLPAPVVIVPGIYLKGASDGSGPGRASRAKGQRGDEFFTVLVNHTVLDLLQAGTSATSATHPCNDIFYVIDGPNLAKDARAAETPRAQVTLDDVPPAPGVVITAIIDTGIPLLNACLRDAQGRSRVQYAWLQNGRARQNDPSFVPHGREFEASDLDDLIDAYSTNGPYLDEMAAYRKMGLADFSKRNRHPLGRQVTHGAHVVGLAAGYPMAENRVDRPVIAVQLPNKVVADTSGNSLAPYLLSALDYIADRADRLAKRMNCGQLPVVINFSFGGTGGPLDGTSFLEQRMDAFLAARNAGHPGSTAIVLPSGNARLSQGHAKVTVERDFKGPDKTEVLNWRVQPDDQTASFVEIWTPSGPPEKRLEVALGAPGRGWQSGFLAEDNCHATQWVKDGKVIAKLSYKYYGAPTNRGRFTIAINPTAKPGKIRGLAPAGTWSITLKNAGLSEGEHVDAWVLRDDELPGFDTDARQSRFEDARYKRHTPTGLPIDDDNSDCPITRQGLQNVLATGAAPVVVAGYMARSGEAARYSAGGLTNTPKRVGPDALAVSDDSRVHWGVISNGVYSGSRVALDGTSVSAPQVARALVDGLANGQPATRAQVAVWAAASEKTDFAHRAPKPADIRGVDGRLQLAPQTNRRYWPKG